MQTPSATPAPSPTPTETVYAFDGDCTNAFSDAELAVVFGNPMTDLRVNWSIGQEEALGGMKCTWWADDSYLGVVMVMTALPAGVAPASVSDAAQCLGEYRGCEATRLTAQGWYSIDLFGSMTTDDPAVVNDLVARAAERGDAMAAPSIPPVTSATWARPVPACSDLVSQLTAPDGFPINLIDRSFDDDSILTPLYDTLGEWCVFSTIAPDEQGTNIEAMISIAVVPGGAVAYAKGVADGNGTPLTIANGEAAELVMPFVAEGNMGIFASDGTNTVAVSTPLGFSTADFAWVAEQLIDALAP